jgi:hypothetical protein
MTEPKNPLGLDQQLCFSVYAAAHAFTAAYKPLLDPLGLTYPSIWCSWFFGSATA